MQKCTPVGHKQILKTKINPGEINVGVNTFKSYNRGVLIETNSKEEIEVLDKEIQASVETNWRHTYTC
jgi:hypothetical protein